MNDRALFVARDVPVNQNKMFVSREAALRCAKGDMILTQDERTGVVSNSAFDPSLITYEDGYRNEQAGSAVFRRHLADVLGLCGRYTGGKNVVEIGCGHGYFLDMMRAAGVAATGVDPSYDGNSPHVIRGEFNAALGLRGDVIILRHVLEHIPDPVRFLHGIAGANGGAGLIYIEVPCLDWSLRNGAWFDLFYEHVNYFRAGDFARMFGTVHESRHMFGGQYLGVIADLATLTGPQHMGTPPPVAFPYGILAGVRNMAAGAWQYRSRVVWGAGGKGATFAHYMGKEGCPLDFAIDINPEKQGKYIAGSGLEVLSPGQAIPRLATSDAVYILNENYRAEIEAIAGGRLNLIPAYEMVNAGC